MGGEEVNNSTRGQRRSIFPANPVASIRWEALLVRGKCSNPVRKNRGIGEAAEPSDDANRPGEPPGTQTPDPAKPCGRKTRTLPEVECLLE